MTTATLELPEATVERTTSALVAWLSKETKLSFSLNPRRHIVGALMPIYELSETTYAWNGMGEDVEEHTLAAGTLDDVAAVVLRLVHRFNHGGRL